MFKCKDNLLTGVQEYRATILSWIGMSFNFYIFEVTYINFDLFHA
jgi:hypothetical protein